MGHLARRDAEAAAPRLPRHRGPARARDDTWWFPLPEISSRHESDPSGSISGRIYEYSGHTLSLPHWYLALAYLFFLVARPPLDPAPPERTASLRRIHRIISLLPAAAEDRFGPWNLEPRT